MSRKVCFITFHFNKYDGQTKAAKNFLLGFKKFGNYQPCLLTAGCSKEMTKEMEDGGIDVINFNKSAPSLLDHTLEYLILWFSKKASKYFDNDSIYITGNDDAVMVSAFKKGPMIYWSQGPAFLMAFQNYFYERNKFIRSIMANGAVPLARKYQKFVSKYDLVLANSKTAATLSAFFLGRLADGIMYPPLDISKYKANLSQPERYALWVSKRDYSHGVSDLLSELAKKINVKIVGNLKIEGAETLGNVSDEQLNELYSNAYITLYPSINEIFGYIPVESMLSGTPVIAYNSGGPSETILNNRTGWLVNSKDEFENLVLSLFEKGYPLEMRKNARLRGEDF
ncbi:MAG: glycosyltransferase family 4 protein, partial [Caldisphaera sp.]